jgi:ABC-type nitrate/sulfonate/bicarbonate transport system ATPase subunit
LSRPGAASLAKKRSANIRHKVVLSTEQQEVLRIVVDEGTSVCFTGSAGTGKSVLLREIIASLRTKFIKVRQPGSLTTVPAVPPPMGDRFLPAWASSA